MKTKYKIMTLLLVASTMQSCNLLGSIDDIKPPYKLTDETLIIDTNSAEKALNGIYVSWRGYDLRTFSYGMFSLAQTQKGAGAAGASDFEEELIRLDNVLVEKGYSSCYYVLNEANSFLVNLEASTVPGLSDTRRNEMIAEARCQRALANLTLLRCFGEYYDLSSKYGICLFENELIRENIARKRSSVQDVYTSILNDLEFAIKYAPSKSEHYYITPTFAKALKARTLMAQGNYNEAAQTAGEVINEAIGNGYELEDNYEDIFTNQFNSSEMLFAPYVSAPNEVVTSYWSGFKPGNLIEEIAKNIDTENNIDSRYQYAYVDPSIVSDYNTNKYPLKEGNTDVNSYYFMRLAEVYYIKAEAEARLGTSTGYTEARKALKTVIERAGYDEEYVDAISDANLLGMILKHKLMDLNAENFEEWFDLVRYHREGGFEGWSADELAVLPKFSYLLLPIPRNAIGGNNLLEQNPEYVVKQ